MRLSKMMSIMIILCIMACNTADLSSVSNSGKTLKRFTQPILDGKTINSDALKGIPLVINFSGPE